MPCPTCKGKTLHNAPCRLKTCKFAPKCYHHTPVEVKRSGVPNAGMGLFARAPIKRGEKLANYTLNTERMTETEFKRKYPNGRATHVAYVRSKGAYFDGKDIRKNIAGAANTAGRRGNGRTNNAKITEAGYLTATKNIPTGREIFTVYGGGYRL